jgi:hypothetical protein
MQLSVTVNNIIILEKNLRGRPSLFNLLTRFEIHVINASQILTYITFLVSQEKGGANARFRKLQRAMVLYIANNLSKRILQ